METFACRFCGLFVTRRAPQRVYCSRVCMAADYRSRVAGADNPAWRGGRWRYKGRRWADISDGVTARDGVCADCGRTDALVAHHRIPQRFWLDLELANEPGNLITLCRPCHARRPEHYWVRVPTDLYRPAVHLELGVMRHRRDIRPKAPCAVCGTPVKRHRSRFCSYVCSNRARWQAGVYGPDLARNITRTRWQVPQGLRDIE